MKWTFIFFFFLSILLFPVCTSAQVYQDYRSDYRTIPAYDKTVQFMIEQDKSKTTFYLKQNLGKSDEESAFVIPLKEKAEVSVLESKNDPWNHLFDIYSLDGSYATKYVDYSLPPVLYSASEKQKFYQAIEKNKLDLDPLFKNRVEDWFKSDYSVLLLIVKPVTEGRTSWMTPIKITTNSNNADIPISWLRKEFGKVTTSKGKVIYSEDFEGGSGGWLDNFEGEQANSLVVRENGEKYEGSYSLKVANKPGSINATSTKTIGNLVPGEHYTFSAYFKNGNATSGDAGLRVMGDGLVVFTSGVPLYDAQSNNWQRISITFQARSAFHFFTLMAAGESGQHVYWDNIQIEKGQQASEFKKIEVGTDNSTNTTEDLVSITPNIQIYLLSEKLLTIGTPVFQPMYYDVKNKELPKGLLKAHYLSVLIGSINPSDYPEFLSVSELDPKTVDVQAVYDRKQLVPNNTPKSLSEMLSKHLFLLVAIVLIFAIRYLSYLLAPLAHGNSKPVIPSVLYLIFWSTNMISTLILSTSLFYQIVSPYSMGGLTNPSDIFLSGIFGFSFILYTLFLFLLTKGDTKFLLRIIQIQIGLTLLPLIIVVSLFISHTLTAPTSDLVSILRLSELPAIFFTLTEGIVLFMFALRIRSHTGTEDAPTPSQAQT